MHYIFEVHLSPGYSAEAYAEAWLAASRIIQQAPGARGTRLHRKIGQPDVLLAIATWDSKAQRDAMEGELPQAVREIIDRAAPYVRIELIGEYEAPEWEVIPPVEPSRDG
jgi:quinol monooxygenase YgiN